MGKFEASNGTTVKLIPDGNACEFGGASGRGLVWFAPDEIDALREFFRAERDEELGRWRWPENPNYVVYPRGDTAVHVLDEASGIGAARYIHRNGDPDNPSAEYQAAYAYFDAHPEPKPWEKPIPGEIWVLTFPAATTAATVRADGLFYDYCGNRLYVNRVSEARRIWPEEAS